MVDRQIWSADKESFWAGLGRKSTPAFGRLRDRPPSPIALKSAMAVYGNSKKNMTARNGAKALTGVAGALALVAVLVVSLSPAPAGAHPTRYPQLVNQSCSVPQPAQILSYHIHMLFWGNSKASTTGAMAVQAAFAKRFGLEGAKPCHGLFHQGRMCMEETNYDAAGPFPVAQWSAFILPENFSDSEWLLRGWIRRVEAHRRCVCIVLVVVRAAVPWIMQHRNGYDILVHPNSGCETEDHTVWPLWGGTPWELDATIFSDDCPGCTPWADDS